MKCRSNSRRNVPHSLACLVAAASVFIFVPSGAQAQLTPWDDTNQVFVDFSVVSDSGVTLFTDTLSWDNVREKIFTDDSVKFITESQDTLYGIGFESDVELNNWKILKPTGVFHEDENDK